MKYQQQITINKPRKEVVAKFSDPDNMKHWQRGFIFMKPINGNLGDEGSQNLLKYEMGKREIEMTETIIKNNLPDEYSATYEAKGVYNYQVNRFSPTMESATLWTTDNEFQFSGFMKLFGWFMPGAFKKQSRKYMEDFKAFVEEGKSVKDH
ncbi:polyketide cyclase/dehydrase/lipid transport protein [Christiangramia gaetbulicola]|uniref:Polyketide cyclase/dehydrase/lipid transport protein n=1 Tax=Christiangramia gaetbulicola TaxID=703340 RepID=A0A2T6AEJ0_9FLAO|nr:SRPBCC family protein [Christiangramia gaetbulicola]PTX42235.1 polyketide cyclase/dehydrase/lipid transport protein [Christiangramia gaetbulicola]